MEEEVKVRSKVEEVNGKAKKSNTRVMNKRNNMIYKLNGAKFDKHTLNQEYNIPYNLVLQTATNKWYNKYKKEVIVRLWRQI